MKHKTHLCVVCQSMFSSPHSGVSSHNELATASLRPVALDGMNRGRCSSSDS